MLKFEDQISSNKLHLANEALRAIRTQVVEISPEINAQEIIKAQATDETCAKILRGGKKQYEI